MAGIYIHIPFCKQACHYCDFHFSTQLKKKEELLRALRQELEIRKGELANTPIETLYFGGGTPSLLRPEELAYLIESAKRHYTFHEQPEITLEVNPDDASQENVASWAALPVNRISLGVQSFFDEDLTFMNRAHTASVAKKSVDRLRRHFDNLSIDLIYGYPLLTPEKWLYNLQTMLSFDIPHLSAYALTVEPKTALHAFIRNGKVPALDEQQAEQHFEILSDTLERAGFIHYEISNFARPGYFSQNNSAYWTGKPYLGIGPAAHSFDGAARSWNVANNSAYIRAISQGQLPITREALSMQEQYNEYVMTGLRTVWGVSVSQIASCFGEAYRKHFLTRITPHLESHRLQSDGDRITASRSGKILIDGIAADLFVVD